MAIEEKTSPAEEKYLPRPWKRSVRAVFKEEHGDQSGWSGGCRRVRRGVASDVAGADHTKSCSWYEFSILLWVR